MFELPPLTPGIDPTLPADKKQLAQWLRQGEGRDISATIRRVYDTLKGLNEAELTDKSRFAMLEMLADPVANIAATLERHYAGLDQPLPPPNRKIALSLGRLLRQFNMGYKRLVMAASAQGSRFDRDGIYALAHRRVVGLSVDSLMVYYRAYLAPPAGIWRDLHRCYQQANSYAIHKTALQGDRYPRSIEADYLTAVLCDLADPYRLVAGDIDRVADFVGSHLDLCRMDGESQEQKRAGQFVVHYQIDAGAHELGDLVLRSERDGFQLDTTRLVKLIHQQLTDLGQQGVAADQWQDHKKRMAMLRCLVVAFALRPNRQQERSAADGELWVVRGLKAVHAHIGAGAVESESFPEIELGDSVAQPVVPMPGGNQMHHWDLLDQSAGGFALLREASGQARVAIGDLLAIAQSPDGPWQTGVVKRVRYRGDEDLIIGVQKLLGQAEAVTVESAEAEGRGLPGLFHRGDAGDQRVATLLLPPGQWLPGDSVRVDRLGKLQLGRILELTGQFEQFEVTAR